MPGGEERAKKIIKRITAMQEKDAVQVLNQTLRDFSNRHLNMTKIFKTILARLPKNIFNNYSTFHCCMRCPLWGNFRFIKLVLFVVSSLFEFVFSFIQI
jgi:hypothetical protein